MPQTGGPFTQIARNTGLIVDKRQTFADQTVEQRGFAHIGTTNDCKGER